METKVSSATKEVIVSYDRPAVIIGERINPTGRKKLTAALKEGDLSMLKKEALDQTAAGAAILDCNVNAAGVDDSKLLPEAIKLVQETVDTPLCIDSPNFEALKAGLKVYKGKPLVNSVSGEKHSLERMLPLIKEYGAAVIGLAQDDEGIPKTADKRVAVAYKIAEAADKIGIPREDIIIDVMTYSIGAEAKSGRDVLEALYRIRTELGLNMTMGLSNISFGLPRRNVLNLAFLPMLMAAGLDSAIMDPTEPHMMAATLAAEAILGRDEFCANYIGAHRGGRLD